MERIILNKLGWNLNAITPLHFLQVVSLVLGYLCNYSSSVYPAKHIFDQLLDSKKEKRKINQAVLPNKVFQIWPVNMAIQTLTSQVPKLDIDLWPGIIWSLDTACVLFLKCAPIVCFQLSNHSA